MKKIESILIYIYSNYPNPIELSKARLVKIIYLADWKFALEYNMQISDTKWYFNHYGPFVKEIIDDIRSSKYFSLYTTNNIYGSEKELIKLNNTIPFDEINLTENEKKVIDFVIEKTSKLYWNEFIRLVYSTFPIMKMPKLSNLNLLELAKEYKTEEIVAL